MITISHEEKNKFLKLININVEKLQDEPET
jgi:hypothetical protein